MILGEIWVSQMSACNGSMTAHGCAGLSSLPLSHAFNPLSIASLGRVVTGLNRCGEFRIQQLVLHSDAETCVSVFPVVPLFLFVAQYRALHLSGSIVPRPVVMFERVASGMLCHQSLHKDTKNFRGFQICTISLRRLSSWSYHV